MHSHILSVIPDINFHLHVWYCWGENKDKLVVHYELLIHLIKLSIQVNIYIHPFHLPIFHHALFQPMSQFSL